MAVVLCSLLAPGQSDVYFSRRNISETSVNNASPKRFYQQDKVLIGFDCMTVIFMLPYHLVLSESSLIVSDCSLSALISL